jgi:hypothetical protein
MYRRLAPMTIRARPSKPMYAIGTTSDASDAHAVERDDARILTNDDVTLVLVALYPRPYIARV